MSIDPRVRQKYCEILGVSINASKSEIKKAYYKASREWHPDKHGNSEEAKTKFQEINNAYEKLNSGDSNEISCLRCGSISNPWRGYSGKDSTQFCSEKCHSDYYNANHRQNNTSNNTNGNRNNGSYTHTHTQRNYCSVCGWREATKRSRSTGLYFCESCYDSKPNCHWCHKKVCGMRYEFYGRTETFCSSECQQNWEKSNSSNSYSNQYSGNEGNHSNYYPNKCNRCNSSIHGDYYTLGSENICASCAQSNYGRTCNNCNTYFLPTRESGWRNTSEGDFCSSSCFNDYLHKSRNRRDRKRAEEEEEKWGKQTCSQCGSPVKDSTQDLCPQCVLEEDYQNSNLKNNNGKFSSGEGGRNESDPSLKQGNRKIHPAPIFPKQDSLITKVQKNAISEIKWELINQEEQLEVDLAEINLSPTELVEEVEKLTNKEDIENYKANLVKKIQQKRGQKLSALKDEAIQTIQEKLKNQKVELEANWEDRIQKLESAQAVAAFVQQAEKEIAEKSQMLSKFNNIPSPNRENKSLLFFGIGIFIVSLGGLIAWFIISSRQKQRTAKN